MRTTSFLTPAALAALVALASSSVACSVDATGASPGAAPEAPPTAASGTPASHGSETPFAVTVLATVPTGVQCVVATVTGADSETVTAAVATGASSVALAFGTLAPGAITVTANAFNSACPGSGPATWVAEPVQATIVAGVVPQIPIVLHPVSTTPGTATFSLPAIAIATGPRTSYAVLSDGTVRAWGANEAGELGTGAAGTSSSTPVVVPGVTNATQIAAGTNYACVIRTDTSVMCWGFDGGSFLTPTPVTGAITAPVLSPGLYATHMSALEGNMVFIGSGATEPVGMAGAASTCTYGGTGACYATDFVWSANGATSPAVSVAAGGLGPLGMLTMCWVTREGTAQCSWNPYVGAVTMVSPAVSVFAGMEAAEGDFACAILANGSVDCWGANTYGELGIGSTSATPIAAVTAAPLPSSVTTMALSRGTITAAHACAVAGGSVYCAGSNASGQLGNMANYATTSFGLVSGVSNAVAVAAGQAHTCALDGEGFVHCWGDNDDGELGDGTTTTRFAAVAVQPW